MGSTGTYSTTCSATSAAFEYAGDIAGRGEYSLAAFRKVHQHQHFSISGHLGSSIAECGAFNSARCMGRADLYAPQGAELLRRERFRAQLRIDPAGPDVLRRSTGP